MATKHKRDRGATIVEAAIILPLLLFIIVTIAELGLAFRTFLTVDFAAKEGARVGAIAGNDVDADCQVVQSVVAGYNASDFDDLDSITIFQVNDQGNSTGAENVWTFNNVPSNDPTDCDDWNKTNNWDSQTRDVTIGASAKLDILGVTVDSTHNWLTGVFPWNGTADVVRTSIQRLEPEAFE